MVLKHSTKLTSNEMKYKNVFLSLVYSMYSITHEEEGSPSIIYIINLTNYFLHIVIQRYENHVSMYTVDKQLEKHRHLNHITDLNNTGLNQVSHRLINSSENKMLFFLI